MILSMLAIQQIELHTLINSKAKKPELRKGKKNQSKKSKKSQSKKSINRKLNKSKKNKTSRKTLDLDFDDRVAELETMGTQEPQEKVDNAVMMSLMSLLVLNLMGKGMPDKRRRRLTGKSKDVFDEFMSGGNITPVLLKEKEKIKGYLNKEGVEFSPKTMFKDVWPHAKDYCRKNFGLDDESFAMIKPMMKKFFKKMVLDKEFDKFVAPEPIKTGKTRTVKKRKMIAKSKKAKKTKKLDEGEDD